MAQCTFGTRIPLLQSHFSPPLSGTRFEMYAVLAKLFTIRSVSWCSKSCRTRWGVGGSSKGLKCQQPTVLKQGSHCDVSGSLVIVGLLHQSPAFPLQNIVLPQQFSTCFGRDSCCHLQKAYIRRSPEHIFEGHFRGSWAPLPASWRPGGGGSCGLSGLGPVVPRPCSDGSGPLGRHRRGRSVGGRCGDL